MASELLDRLRQTYPDAGCELTYTNDFELLISVILSAQCTDKRVNIVTRELFRIAPTADDVCAMDLAELERIIKSCGLYKNKAANIKSCCRDIVERFGGVIPQTMDELVTLAGVGRKTANVMLGVAFGKPAIAVDTHVFRLSHRLGLSAGSTPDAVEKDLCALFEPDDYRDVHFLLIKHGRECCYARNPDCEKCCLSSLCGYGSARKV